MTKPIHAAPSADPAPRTRRVVLAWHQGEGGGSYDKFRQLLAPDFDYFSHAFLGAKRGAEARQALNDLIAERERHPGALTFRDLLCFEQEDYGIVRYYSSGIVSGPARISYDGPAVILFHFSGNRIRGFEESLGWFDPAWQRPQASPMKA
jgi:hypothetical protein